MTAAVLPMGERAVLVELDDLDTVLALHAALAASAPDGVEELVPAARTVLVRFDPRRIAEDAVRRWIGRTDAAETSVPAAPEIVIEVRYDGPDLDDTARMLGLGADALATRHAATAWRVAFTGFAPGFGYLVGEDWPYDVPRLAAPRTRVPAGSVALAAGYTGAYPRATPGGWRLIGTTEAPLFDPEAEPAALLTPGARVRFVAVRAASVAAGVDTAGVDTAGVDTATAQHDPSQPASPPPVGSHGRVVFVQAAAEFASRLHENVATAVTPAAVPDAARPALRVERAANATVQDLGRPALAHIGVARSGALDRGALRLANRLVGNAEDAAGIEIAPGGFAATARRDLWFAVTGTWAPLRLGGHALDAYRAHLWPAGERLEVGIPAHGARAYLAVRGGLDTPLVLGARAADTLAGLGPARLAAGEGVPVGRDAAGLVPPLDLAPWGWPPAELELRVRPGPRAGWFTAAARRILRETRWVVTAAADRIGVRLDGPALERRVAGELPSEGMVPGALQVPPSGRPVILLADGPVTGGYPVIAVIEDRDLDLVAQAPPGARLRLRGV